MTMRNLAFYEVLSGEKGGVDDCLSEDKRHKGAPVKILVKGKE